MGNLLSEPKLKGIIDDSQIKTPIYFEGKVKKSLSNNDAVELLPKYGNKWVEAPISSLEKIALLPSANETSFNAKVWLKSAQLSPQAFNAQAIFYHLIWDRPSLTPAGQRIFEELSEEERRRRNCRRFVDVSDRLTQAEKEQRCAETGARLADAEARLRRARGGELQMILREVVAVLQNKHNICLNGPHLELVNDCNRNGQRGFTLPRTFPNPIDSVGQAKQPYSGKEFLQFINKQSFRQERTFVGVADKYDGNDDSLLFSANLDCASWIKLNLDGIEQIEYLDDDDGCGDHTHPIVSLTLKSLDTQKPAEHMLLKLLSSLLE